MRLADSLKANAGLKLLALFMAASLWYAATQRREVEANWSVPVVLDNLPPHLALADEPPRFVSLVVSGRKSALRMEEMSGVKAVLDLGGVGPGTVSFDCQASVKLRSGLRVVRVQPARIELRLVKGE